MIPEKNGRDKNDNVVVDIFGSFRIVAWNLCHLCDKRDLMYSENDPLEYGYGIV